MVIIYFIHSLIYYIPSDSSTQRIWIILEGGCVLISLYLLFKIGCFNKHQCIIAFTLSILVSLSYIANHSIYQMIIFGSISLIAILAIFSVFKKYPDKALPFIKHGKYQPLLTIVLSLIIGSLLGVINITLGAGKLVFNFNIYCLLTTFSPTILEELMLRTLFYALCIYLFKGQLGNRGRKFTCLFMMIIPHVLIHTPDVFIQFGLISGLVNTSVYIILYGLPFALLQKKWDLTSAMLTHGIVDFIRFCFVGLPF